MVARIGSLNRRLLSESAIYGLNSQECDGCNREFMQIVSHYHLFLRYDTLLGTLT